MKKQGTYLWRIKFTSRYRFNISTSCSLFLQDIVKICSSLTWSCILCFLLLTINKILNPFSLLASSFALVQLGLIFSFVPSFLSESTWPSLSKRQNYQLGSFCDICELWRFCFIHFCKSGKFVQAIAWFQGVFGINTASDISKLSLISRAASVSDIKNNFEISRAVFMPNIP